MMMKDLPAQSQEFLTALMEMMLCLKGYTNVKFFEDPSLQHGDCQVKSRFGLLDGRISTKLRRLEEEITGD